MPESVKDGARGLAEGSDIGLGPGDRAFEPHYSDQNVLMKDAAQKTPRKSAVFSHIYQLFHRKKLEKQDFSKKQFFTATGDILEMQQGIFMN